MSMSFNGERYATYAGIRTRELAVEGDGPTVVLVHGFAHAAETWVPVLESFRETGQAAVAVDLPGFGDADPLGAGPLMPQVDSFVAEVIRHYGRTTGVVAVGNSLGAAAVARAGRDGSLPLTAVMALDIAGITWKPLVSLGLAPVSAATGWCAGIGRPRRLRRAVVTAALGRGLYGRRAAVDREVVAALAERVPDLREAHRLVVLGSRFKAELDRESEPGGILAPLVAVHGARDRLVPVSSSRILHEANPGSRLVVLPHAGHCPQLDATAVIAGLARELATISSASKEIS